MKNLLFKRHCHVKTCGCPCKNASGIGYIRLSTGEISASGKTVWSLWNAEKNNNNNNNKKKKKKKKTKKNVVIIIKSMQMNPVQLLR